MMKSFERIAAVLVVTTAIAAPLGAQTLLNVSYDPTRELYVAINAAFNKQWQGKTGKTVQIRQSHGGSGARSRRGHPRTRLRHRCGAESGAHQ
jgi:ABC-type sulfate transport system substrate-binding protein